MPQGVTIARYVLSLGILLLAAYIVVLNWSAVIISMRNKRRGIDRHHSTVPGVSLLLTALALLFYPHPDKAVWMLAVPLLDVAHWNLVFALVWLPVMLIRALSKHGDTEPPAGGAGGEGRRVG